LSHRSKRRAEGNKEGKDNKAKFRHFVEGMHETESCGKTRKTGRESMVL
jgi:hypothetical protein